MDAPILRPCVPEMSDLILMGSVVHGPQQPLACNEYVDEGVMDNPLDIIESSINFKTSQRRFEE